MRRLRRFFSLPTAERVLARRALWTLVLVRFGLALLPFAALRRRVEQVGAADGPEDPATARAVRRAVDRAARTIPGSACLAQAFTAEAMLRRAGVRVSTSIGVTAQGRPMAAHAWVESAGILVTGDTVDVHAYARLITYGAERLKQAVPSA